MSGVDDVTTQEGLKRQDQRDCSRHFCIILRLV